MPSTIRACILMSFLKKLIILLVFVLNSEISEAQILKSSYGFFKPGLNVENESDLAGIYAIAATLQILDHADPVVFNRNQLAKDLNFFFASGDRFIENERVSPRSIGGLPRELVKAVTSLPTNTSVCYVQGFTVGSERNRIVLSVHNSEGGDTEDSYRCFTAAVWYFKWGDLENVDLTNWKSTILGLLGGQADGG